MILTRAVERLQSSGAYLPAFERTVENLRWFETLDDGVQYGELIPRLYNGLEGQESATVQIWRAAWATVACFWMALDSLQDGDVIVEAPGKTWLETSHILGAKYNRAASLLMLSSALIDDLDRDAIGNENVAALRRLFNDCVLRTASGQQADLDSHIQDNTVQPGLDDFARLMQLKSGAVYELAFGGTALLVTTAPNIVGPVQFAGLLYGTLLQFSDDVTDAERDTESPLTLSRAFTSARTSASVFPLADDLHSFLKYTYSTYYARLERAIEALPVLLQDAIREIYRDTFERARKSRPV